MAEDVTPYDSIHEALDALDDFLRSQWFSQDPDPHVVRIVLRNGQQYQAKVRKANKNEITLVNLPPHGATRQINAADITYLAVALPAPRRLLTVALTTLALGDVIVVAARLLHPWLGKDSLIILTLIVATVALFLFRISNQPGSKLLPWVVTFSEPTAVFSEPTASG